MGEEVPLSIRLYLGFTVPILLLRVDSKSVQMTTDMSAKSAYDKVFTALEAHHSWFAYSIPLIASDNVPSPAVREAIISYFGNRYA